MTNVNAPRCPECHALFAPDDNYCRSCGLFLGTRRLPTLVEARKPAPRTNGAGALPAPVRRMATAVAVGAALQIGLGIAGRLWAWQTAARQARALSAKGAPRPEFAERRRDAPTVDYAELVVLRRWRFPRG